MLTAINLKPRNMLMIRVMILLNSALLISGCVTNERLRYTQINPLPNREANQVSLIINTYPLKTPSPTVIYAHGCSGLDGAYLNWKNKLNDWGYNVVQPDSLRSRGFKSACKKVGVANITHNDRLEDILKTAEWIKEQPWHQGKIGLIGFSMGGRAALNLASDGGDLYIFKSTTPSDRYKNINISVAVVYYSFCQPMHKNATIPVLILNGANDTQTPSTWCQFIAEENKNIDFKLYPDTFHGFDTPGAYGMNKIGFVNQFNETAAKDAESRTKGFFEMHLKN